jgi:dephospho-CoA kinase
MLRIGLTGGIGSGKSSVAQCFSNLSVPVIDADSIAHELTAPGMPVLQRIADVFGTHLIDEKGMLLRPVLRSIVFSDAGLRKQLEAILHPLIRQEMDVRVQKLDAPYCVCVVPLLLETGQSDSVQRILVVDVPHYLQYTRVMARDGSTAADVAAVIRAQIGFRERLAQADDIIVNDQGQAALQQRVAELHQSYLVFASDA